MSNHPDFPLIVKVNAYDRWQREDYKQAAAFANVFRAANYAQLLVGTGQFHTVTITDAHGEVTTLHKQ